MLTWARAETVAKTIEERTSAVIQRMIMLLFEAFPHRIALIIAKFQSDYNPIDSALEGPRGRIVQALFCRRRLSGEGRRSSKSGRKGQHPAMAPVDQCEVNDSERALVRGMVRGIKSPAEAGQGPGTTQDEDVRQ
jgi:hypothetical protein